ncbi:MAG: hypothetical protein M3Z21_05080, partial [Pseudomonadota bacterium]|nr:hypothetical protein [Pseudomonadota bacterium]
AVTDLPGTVTAGTLTATAATGIGSAAAPLTTAVIRADLQVTGTGNIAVNESDDLSLTRAAANNGDVTLTAAQGRLFSTDNTANTVAGNALTATAATGIDLNTDVRSATLTVTDAGDIIIRENDVNGQNGLELGEVQTAAGDIDIRVRTGDLVIDGMVSAPAGSVVLVAGEERGLDPALDPGDIGFRVAAGGSIRVAELRFVQAGEFHVEAGERIDLVAFEQIGEPQLPISLSSPVGGTLNVSSGGRAFFSALNNRAFAAVLGIAFNVDQAREAAQQEAGREDRDFGFVDPGVFLVDITLLNVPEIAVGLPPDQLAEFAGQADDEPGVDEEDEDEEDEDEEDEEDAAAEG